MFISLCGLVIHGDKCESYGQKIDRKRPSVFIAFAEFVEIMADGANPSVGAKFVLHNNTRWPIFYDKNYDPTVGAGAVIYTIELEDGKRDFVSRVDVVSKGKIMPGATVSFIVPRGVLTNARQIYVDFNFSWELTQARTVRREAFHQAYFVTSDLPHWPERTIRQLNRNNDLTN